MPVSREGEKFKQSVTNMKVTDARNRRCLNGGCYRVYIYEGEEKKSLIYRLHLQTFQFTFQFSNLVPRLHQQSCVLRAVQAAGAVTEIVAAVYVAAAVAVAVIAAVVVVANVVTVWCAVSIHHSHVRFFAYHQGISMKYPRRFGGDGVNGSIVARRQNDVVTHHHGFVVVIAIVSVVGQVLSRFLRRRKWGSSRG